MSAADFIVLFGYFALLIVIGIICSFAIKKQEDYFLGGRGFGKLLQTFAAFGAGTGAQDPINLGRTTWTSGLSGIWVALCWLFVTPFYWIFAVWYRRMRHLTLGDWFVERFQSKAMGVAYTVFAFSFQILYLSVMFSAISKVVEPLLGPETTMEIVSFFGMQDAGDLKFVLVPLIAAIVLIYGILGGLSAAYWTDLLQGIGIIALSLILIPFGLKALVENYGSQYPELAEGGRQQTIFDGFTIMHDRLTDDYFRLMDTPQSGEFPAHFIIALIFISLVGIVIQPHFIATGGGSAKTELSARVGLVSGNFLKRLCTIGWALTGLIAAALFAGSVELAEDPDRVWGVASREILAPIGWGLVGLMLACLLAALMSSADTYMLVSSALLVRNVYAAYIDPNASERTYVVIGRIAGLCIILGAVFVSVSRYDVFGQYVLALEVAASFSAPFWIGMFWRRATKLAAWVTILFSVMLLLVAPILTPILISDLRNNQDFHQTTGIVTTTRMVSATEVDVERRAAKIEHWDAIDAERNSARETFDELLATEFSAQMSPTDFAIALKNSGNQNLVAAHEHLAALEAQLSALGERPEPLSVDQEFQAVYKTGGRSIFWSDGIVDPETGSAPSELITISEETDEETQTTIVRQAYSGETQGAGRFNVEFLLYHYMGFNFSEFDNASLKSLSLLPRIVTPFLVMIFVSLITPRGNREALDRYYAKMKTPVHPDPEYDQNNLEAAYRDPLALEEKKLFPGTNLEFGKPRAIDVLGFLISVGICILFVQIILWLVNIGA